MSMTTTILDTTKTILASRGVQIFTKFITWCASAVGGAAFVDDQTTAAMAAGAVALVGVIIDFISHKLQKSK